MKTQHSRYLNGIYYDEVFYDDGTTVLSTKLDTIKKAAKEREANSCVKSQIRVTKNENSA